VRQGTLEEIRAGLTVESQLRVTAARPLDAEALSKLESVRSVNVQNGSVSLSVLNPAQSISALVRYLGSQQNELTDIAVSQPTLEDLFLKVVGERLAGEDG